MSAVFFDRHVSAAKQAEIEGKLSLALREWKEAVRLRPHSPAVKELERLSGQLKPVSEPKISLAKFAAQFNLAVYYWDCGRAALALSEAKKAMQSFSEVFPGRPCGCAAHHVKAIKNVQGWPAMTETATAYTKGVGFFDRRMLKVANVHFSAALEEAKLRRDGVRVEGIQEDIKFLAELRDEFCKQRGPLLPCLLSRFSKAGDLDECVQWWESLRDDGRITWN